MVIDGEFWIPTSVVDLESFRRWILLGEWPSPIRLSFLAGVFWIDRTMEQMSSHNAVKTEVARVLSGLANQSRLGRYLGDGMSLINPAAGLSTVPDGFFVSYASLRAVGEPLFVLEMR